MAQNTMQKTGAVYAGNFIMQANAPLDDRSVVESKSQLLEFNNYVYPGMLVVTLDTNELYQLTDVNKKSDQSFAGWKKVGTDQAALDSALDSKADQSDLDELEARVEELESTTDKLTSDLEEASGKVSDLETNLERVEQVTSTALNDLDGRTTSNTNSISSIQTLLEQLQNNALNIYEQEVTSGSNITIKAADHHCGKFPSVTVYYGNSVAFTNAEVNSLGDITLTWTAAPSQATPIRVVLIGKAAS